VTKFSISVSQFIDTFRIVELPMIVFIDELQKDFPLITIEHDQEVVKFTASMKRHPYGLRTAPSPTQYIAFYKGDGVSRTFQIPYGT